ncbi:MAG: transposase, partial [Hyphomonadaceae bacterium]|nr:transposase [Hyphomonadaceae bacterium]
MYRARRNHPLSARQKRFNRLVARQRWVIEQSFGTLKRL